MRTRLVGAELEAVLRAAPEGFELWVPGLGPSLWPLLRTGDAVRLKRTGAEGIQPGDLVLCVGAGSRWIHPVVATAPLRTASLRGVLDPPGEVLGVAVALRRGGRRYRVGAALRSAVLGWARLALAARKSPSARRWWRAGVAALGAPVTAPLRVRLVGLPRVRLLGPADEAALLSFVGDEGRLAPAVALASLDDPRGEKVAAGAFGRGGGLVGLACVGRYTDEGVAAEGLFVRGLFVTPRARALGIARALLEVLCAQADQRGLVLQADVRADNRASLAAFARAGFVREDAAASAATRAVLEERLGQGPLVLLTRRPHSA